MDKLLYKGLEAYDHFKNRDAVQNNKNKDDYLFKPIADGLRPEPRQKKDDIFHYNMNIPQRDEHSSVKVLNDTESLFQYMMSQENSLVVGENFQKSFCRDLPKLLWQSERMEDLGDYLLLFPNPDMMEGSDHIDNNKLIDNGLTLKEAQSSFRKIFENQYQYPYKRKFMTSLHKAYELAFLELDEVKVLSAAEKVIYLKEKAMKAFDIFKGKKKEKTEKVKEEVPVPEMVSQSLKKSDDGKTAVHRDMLNDSKHSSEKKEKIKHSLRVEELSPELISLKERPQALTHDEPGVVNQYYGKHKLEKKPIITRQDTVAASPDLRIHGSVIDNNTKKGTETGDKKLDPEEEKRIAELKKLKLRRIWGGRQYCKPQKIPGKSKTPNYWDHCVIDNKADIKVTKGTRDFLTLLRKTTCAALANQGFLIREIFVNNGKQIALVLTLPERNMHKIAEQMKMSKTVEFGVADLMSLEPIDEKNRPMRVNAYLLDEQLWEKQYTPHFSTDKIEEVLSLRRQIKTLLDTDCNFKRIVRMCEGTWTDTESDYQNNIFDHSIPSLHQWIDYLFYLRCLSMHVRNIMLLKSKINIIEKEFYGTRKMAACGNKDRRDMDKCEVSRLVNRLVVRAMLDTIKLFPGLKNLWDVNGTSPTNYAYEYTNATNKMRPRNRRFYDIVWMDYFYHYPYNKDTLEAIQKFESEKDALDKAMEDKGLEGNIKRDDTINPEEKPITVYNYKFSSTERLKIVNYLVNKIIDIEALSKLIERMDNLVNSTIDKILLFVQGGGKIFFPLHNRTMTEGTNYHKIFEDVRRFKKFYNTVPSETIKIQVHYDDHVDDGYSIKDVLEMSGRNPVLESIIESRREKSKRHNAGEHKIISQNILDQSYVDLERLSMANRKRRGSIKSQSASMLGASENPLHKSMVHYQKSSTIKIRRMNSASNLSESKKLNILDVPLNETKAGQFEPGESRLHNQPANPQASVKFRLATVDRFFGYSNDFLNKVLTDSQAENKRADLQQISAGVFTQNTEHNEYIEKSHKDRMWSLLDRVDTNVLVKYPGKPTNRSNLNQKMKRKCFCLKPSKEEQSSVNLM